MLKITSDGRKLGLDQRLMNTLLPDDPDSKLNACVGNILRIWQDGQADKLTQLVFCDLSTPKNDGTFNVYAAGVFGQPRFAFAQVDEVHSRASGKAAALAHQRAAYACGVIDPFALRTADQLYKSLAVACGDRKYFSSTLGSKMSISDKVDAFPVLRNAVEA